MANAFRLILVEPPGQKGFLPLASGYLAATALADPRIAAGLDIKLIFEHVSHPLHEVLASILGHEPHAVAFSCQGWAMKRADELARHVREASPDTAIIYGGNHVSNGGHGFFAERPYADILVNGEGEFALCDVIAALRRGPDRSGLAEVEGISFRSDDGAILHTPTRARIADLDSIPSPYLEGVLDYASGNYSTVMLETNRGCPYGCSFCYWGGATQTKVRKFSLDRLKREMRLLAEAKIDTWLICDANFGILQRDLEIVEEIVRLRKLCGYPKSIQTNWAKHSNEHIIQICARLNEAGIHASYLIALQSTDPHTLEIANRKNMSVNKIEEISQLCRQYGIIPKGELIWGLPGETYETFLNSYDELADFTDTLSVYPLYIIPNTEYSRRKEELKIKTTRAEVDTVYEYCISHYNMTEEDFHKGLRFIISNNILRVAGAFLYVYPRVASAIAGIRYSEIVAAFEAYVCSSDDPVLAPFKKFYRFPLSTHRQSLAETWNALLRNADALVRAVHAFVDSEFRDRLNEEQRRILREALDFDMAIYPRFDSREEEQAQAVAGEYLSRRQFSYDFLSVYRGEPFVPRPSPSTYEFRRLSGLWRYPYGNLYFGLLSFRAQVREYPSTEQPALAPACAVSG